MSKRAPRGFVAFLPAIGVEAWCRLEEDGQVEYRTAPVIAWCITRTGRTDALLMWSKFTQLASEVGAVSIEFRRTL